MLDHDRPARRVATALVVAAALVLTGCGGRDPQPDASPGASAYPDSDAGPGALVVDGEVDIDAVGAWHAAVLELDDEAREQQADQLSGALERQLYEVSGLADALGGPAAVERSIVETARWMQGLAAQAADAAPARPAGRVAPYATGAPTRDEGTSFGEGIFGGLLVAMLGADAAVSATNSGETGNGELAPGVTIRSTGTEAELATNSSFTDKTGVTTTLEARSTLTPCPDANGVFRASSHLQVSNTVGGGRTGKRGTFDVAVEGRVGDNAELLGFDTDLHGQLADFKDSRGGYVEFSAGFPGKDVGGDVSFVPQRTGGTVTAELQNTAYSLSTLVGLMVAEKLAQAAKKGWESGRCVSLTPTVSAGPSNLRPSQEVQIVAAPRSKVDGGKVGGTVTAVLSGQSSITPQSAPADATFVYVAPPKREMRASVALESRSRRGVAKATVELDTWPSAYVASGHDEVTWGGKVNSLTGGFSVDATFPGGSATFYFDGAREDGGGVEVSGGGSGASLTGGGTYTMTERDDGVVLVSLRVRTCVNVSKICRTTSHQITLTPQR